MAETDPEEAQHHRQKDAEDTDEHSGYSIDGDTPPSEGLGVGPTNPQVDIERPGEGPRNKVWLVLILAVVSVFVVPAIIGRIAGTI